MWGCCGRLPLACGTYFMSGFLGKMGKWVETGYFWGRFGVDLYDKRSWQNYLVIPGGCFSNHFMYSSSESCGRPQGYLTGSCLRLMACLMVEMLASRNLEISFQPLCRIIIWFPFRYFVGVLLFFLVECVGRRLGMIPGRWGLFGMFPCRIWGRW